MLNKFVGEGENPSLYIREHILKGDGCDGVPNVLSPDDVFVSGGRQTPLRTKKITEIADQVAQGTLEKDDPQLYANFIRNAAMIDLTCIPPKIKDKILSIYNTIDSNTVIQVHSAVGVYNANMINDLESFVKENYSRFNTTQQMIQYPVYLNLQNMPQDYKELIEPYVNEETKKFMYGNIFDNSEPLIFFVPASHAL